jgi:putative thioredoxin
MPDTATADPIKNGTDASFMADVIQASKEATVLVDFWAPWCGPCRQLTPLLEKQVSAAGGKVRLVKINIDENPAIAGQLGVRSIPAVFAFVGGRPVDGFMGLLPESQLKMFIDRLTKGGDGAADDVPEGEDINAALEAAQEAFAAGDVGSAAQIFAAVLQADEANIKAIAGLARCQLAAGQPDMAREILAMAPAEQANAPELASVRTALELAAEGANAGDPAKLVQTLAANPKDKDARFNLAKALAARGQIEEAVEHLLTLLEQDRAWNEEAARKQLLKIFEAAGGASDIAKSGRRRMSAILFS